MTLSYTKNLHLAVPDFLTEPWHDEFAQAMDSIDQIVFSALVAADTALWMNNTVYAIGDLVIDPDTGGIFSAAIAHTSSPAPQTFTNERLAHPTFWTAFAPVLATQVEAEAGLDNVKYMSPLRVAQAIDVQSPLAGVASQAEAVAGTNNTQMMTPLRTAQSVSSRVRGAPQGRLTLISDQPVMTTSMVSTPLIYYTPFTGVAVPIWNGSDFDVVSILDELPANVTDVTHNPGPVGGSAVVDWFVWRDSAPVTISISSPSVISYASHGFVAGQPFQFTTTGTLPTGVSADTTYYVLAAGFTANTFQFSLARGGTPINATGTQSGTHTLNARRLTHGPDWASEAARSLPLTKIRGVWVNNAPLVNGPPGVGAATYVGTTRSIGGGLLAWRPFSTVFAEPCLLLVYNAHNRVPIVAGKQDQTSSWQYGPAPERDSNGNPQNRVWVVDGLGDSFSRVVFGTLVLHDAAGVGQINIQAMRDGVPVGGILRLATTGAGFAGYDTLIASFDIAPTMGVYFAQARELGGGSPVTFHGGAHYSLTMGISL